MIENLGCCKNTKFTLDKWVVDKTLRSRFFHNSEEIGGANEIKEFKGTVVIERPYQCGTAMYKLTKLRMLKFHDFLDKSLNRQDLSYVTWILICFTQQCVLTIYEIVKSGLRPEYEVNKKNWLATHRTQKLQQFLLCLI